MNIFLFKNRCYCTLFVFMVLSTLSASLSAQYMVLNKGVAGNNTENLLARIEKDLLSEKPDLVILMAGTNDMVNSRKMISYAQFETNYQKILQILKSHHIKVVTMSPPPVDTGYLFMRHDRKLYREDPNLKIDTLNQLIKKLSKANKCHFIDLHAVFKAAGSPNRTANSLTVNEMNLGIADGIHPTKEGYLLIANTIYAHLLKNKLLKSNRKILCFGDSMTYGSFMQGAGTTNGETYPAILSKLLETK
jgi:lysophospholipase L1-like esterase